MGRRYRRNTGPQDNKKLLKNAAYVTLAVVGVGAAAYFVKKYIYDKKDEKASTAVTPAVTPAAYYDNFYYDNEDGYEGYW